LNQEKTTMARKTEEEKTAAFVGLLVKLVEAIVNDRDRTAKLETRNAAQALVTFFKTADNDE